MVSGAAAAVIWEFPASGRGVAGVLQIVLVVPVHILELPWKVSWGPWAAEGASAVVAAAEGVFAVAAEEASAVAAAVEEPSASAAGARPWQC